MNQQFNPHSINQLIQGVSYGNYNPKDLINVPNLSGNEYKRRPFEEHCEGLCQKNETNILKLLTVILQKIYGDMNERLLRSPIFKQKVINIIDEWGYNNNLEPSELFECPETCYDPTNIDEIEKMIGNYDNELNIIDQNIENENENYNLYDKIQSLKDNYNNCGEQIQENLIDIDNRYNDFQPKYPMIIWDLSTKHKPYYLDQMIQEDKNELQPRMIHHVNQKMNKDIPDNINNIFTEIPFLSMLIQKNMQNYKNRLNKMNQINIEKQNKLNMLSDKIGPNNIPNSILDMIQNFISFKEDTESEEDELTEKDLENKLSEIVESDKDKKKKHHKKKNNQSDDSDDSDDDVYYLKMEGENNESDNNESDNSETFF